MAMGPLPPPWDRFVPFAEKIFVWAMVFAVLWLLRPFFFLVFLTFVFGYILQHIVVGTERRIPSRRLRVVCGFLLILSILVAVGFWMGPALAQQAKDFPAHIEANLGKLDEFIERLRRDSPSLKQILPEDVRARDILAEVLGLEAGEPRGASAPWGYDGAETRLPSAALEQAAKGLELATDSLAQAALGGEGADEALRRATEGLELVERSLDEAKDATEIVVPVDPEAADAWKNILPKVIGAAQLSFSIGSAFLLSLLFSFLIVYDFPNLARGARHLHDTRLQFVYDEVSDSVFHFARVLGQALEAQVFIAIVNTALTALGMSWLELPNKALLSMIVFVCSFIPVAGVFISSVPICAAALTKGDVDTLFAAIAFITLIHIIEAYILNPRIYSARLRMNPVLVLAILVISHHLFGMWGLILGVPVVNYLLRYVIDIKARRGDEMSQAA